MSHIKELKEKLSAAKLDYLAVVHLAPEGEVRKKSDAVKDLSKQLSDEISKGAVPCKACKTAPIGLEQPGARGRVEYEVGCLTCPAKARGGMLPRHSVELWNAMQEEAE